MIFFYILADILCDFEENWCNFEQSTTDTQDTYKWRRRYPDQLSETEGPFVDWNKDPLGNFTILKKYV